MKEHAFEICRASYAVLRESGSPSVIVRELWPGNFYAETSDGRVRSESLTGCCRWNIKAQLAYIWFDKK